MPRVKKDDAPAVRDVAAAGSKACRRCSLPVVHDEIPEDGVIRCEHCGVANLIDEEA